MRTDNDLRERWVDPAKPLLLHAVNLNTRDTGFFRGAFDGSEPKQLIMAAKDLAMPVKAKDADVYLLTEQLSTSFPT